MKTRTRINALAITATTAITSAFFAAPAFAHGDDLHVDEFSSAGQPVDVVATSIVGIVLLAVVLIGSTLIGNIAEKRNK